MFNFCKNGRRLQHAWLLCFLPAELPHFKIWPFFLNLLTTSVQQAHTPNRNFTINDNSKFIINSKGFLTTSPNRSPSGDIGGCPSVENAVICSQTHRFDVVCELNSWAKLQQGDVVVLCCWRIVWMDDNPGHTAGFLIGIKGLLGETSEVNGHLRFGDADGGEKG